jgi:hypothetical protein
VVASGVGPFTYEWTGTGNFSPSTSDQNVIVNDAGSGNYFVSVSNGCAAASSNVLVLVTPAPSATIAYVGTPFCGSSGVGSVTLSGTVGGTFSSLPSGLDIDAGTGSIELATSASGTYTVTYTISGSGGCPQFTTSTSVSVNTAPTVSAGSYGPLCSGDASITLTGSPAGGTWSGTGITGNQFNPAAGTQTINYTVTQNGCTGSASTTITVNAAPTVTTGSYGPLCSGDATIALTGSPVGGTWSGTGVTGNQFNPAVGTQTINYTVTQNGCTGSASTTITVNAAPTVTTGSYGPLCSGDASITLTGSPLGGTWSGTGITGNQFNPAAGTQTINYTVTQNGCTGSASTTITVNAAPTVTTGSYGPLCSGAASITLAGSPVGGTWSGTGVTGNQFDPAAGTQTINYTVTQNGCTGSASTTITVNSTLTVTTGSYGPLCSGAAAITLTGSPVGGTWSGTGVTGNQFNPSAGTQTINYAVTQNGCTGSASTTITVNTAPTVTTGSYGPLCSGDASITLTGSPVGGTWSGTGVSGNQFNPSAGTQSINYAVTQNGCTGSASTTITVNTAPTVTTGSYGPLCSGDASITLTGSPVGGTWSGTGVSGNQFNPSAGTQTINYAVTQNGCTGSASTTITVNVAPTVTTGSYGPLCSGDASITLTGSPVGGTWSGTGVTGNQFDPAAGTQTVNYVVTQNGCTGSASTTITVNAAPTVTTGSYGPLCSGSALITLSGAPLGGTWSGTGVTGNQFNPAAGTQIINYAVTQNGCTGSASTTITVNTAPTVSTGSYGPLCSGDASITLTGSPVGGTWSGTGVTGNQFDPAAGTQTLNYAVTQNGCTGSASTTITVNTAPTVSTGSYGPLCSGAASITLSGAPVGGTWSGTGVTGNQFDPAAGTQTLSYTLTQNGCTSSASTTITVNTAPTVTTGSYGPSCSGDASITLTGSPVGGIWSGTGVTGNQFNPAAGTQTLSYTLTQNGCTGSASTTITVNAAPTVTTGSYGPLCSGDASINLTGSPLGGTWSGTGVTGNQFNPAAGTQTLSYTLTQNGCTGSASTTITVNTAPTVTTGSYGPLCSGDASVTLVGSPVGGSWTGTGVTGDQFNPAVGNQTVTYTVTVAGCTASANTTITVNSTPNVGPGNYGPACSGDLPIQLAGTPVGGTWSGTGVTGNQFDPSFGTQTITYSVTQLGCTATGNVMIMVNSTPLVEAGSYDPLCSSDAPILLVGTPAGGAWSGIGVQGDQFNPAAGTQSLTYSVTQIGCTGSSTVTVIVVEPEVVDPGFYGPVCSNGEVIVLDAQPAGGTWSGSGVSGNGFNPTVGTQVLTYTVVQGSCETSANTTITVFDAPVAGFTVGTVEPEVNVPVSFVNTTVPAASYQWVFGDGTFSAEENPVHIYTLPGTYTVTLTAFQGDCADSFTLEVVVEIGTGIALSTIDDIRVWCDGEHFVIERSIASGGMFQADVFDARGRLMRSGIFPAIPGRTLLSSSGLSTGIWTIVIRSEDTVRTFRVPLLR